MLFLGQTHFGKLYMDICLLNSVVLWPYYILLLLLLYIKCIIFGIVFGEMHGLLTCKIWATLT